MANTRFVRTNDTNLPVIEYFRRTIPYPLIQNDSSHFLCILMKTIFLGCCVLFKIHVGLRKIRQNCGISQLYQESAL